MLGAGVHHALQLQLAQLALRRHRPAQRLPQRVVCGRQRYGRQAGRLGDVARVRLAVPRRRGAAGVVGKHLAGQLLGHRLHKLVAGGARPSGGARSSRGHCGRAAGWVH